MDEKFLTNKRKVDDVSMVSKIAKGAHISVKGVCYLAYYSDACSANIICYADVKDNWNIVRVYEPNDNAK